MIGDEMKECNGENEYPKYVTHTIQVYVYVYWIRVGTRIFRSKQSLHQTNNKWFYRINSQNFSELLKQKE